MAALKLRIKKFDEDLRDLCESDGEDGFMLSLDDRTYKSNPPSPGARRSPAWNQNACHSRDEIVWAASISTVVAGPKDFVRCFPSIIEASDDLDKK